MPLTHPATRPNHTHSEVRMNACILRTEVHVRAATCAGLRGAKMAGGEQGAERLESAQLRARIVELRRRRLTFAQIATEVGRAESTVWEHYQAAVKDIPAAQVDIHRQEMLDQLDEAERAVLAVLHSQHITVSQGRVVRDDDGSTVLDDGPILDAARTLVALQARKAKLLGADAPTRSEVDLSGGVRYEVVGVDPGGVV